MATVRLNKEYKNDMIHGALADIYKAKSEELIARVDSIRVSAWEAAYGEDHNQLKALTLSHEWMQSREISIVTFTGQNDEVFFKSIHKDHINDPGWIISLRKLRNGVSRPFPTDSYGAIELPAKGNTKLIRQCRQVTKDIEALLADYSNYERDLRIFLSSCTTLKHVEDNMPELTKYCIIHKSNSLIPCVDVQRKVLQRAQNRLKAS